MKQKSLKTALWSSLLLLLGTGLLAGCAGGILSSNTSTSSSSNTVMQGPPPANDQGSTDISGTITAYNAAQKTLTIRTTNGTTRIFSLSGSSIEKSQRITLQTLKTLLATDKSLLRFTGKLSSGTTYTAQQVTVMNASNQPYVNLAGNNPSNNGTPPATNGSNVPGGNPPTGSGLAGNGAPPSGTPPATNGGAQPMGTPPANNGNASPGGAPSASNSDQGIILQNARLQNNQLLATTFSGRSITVDLTSSTSFIQQVSGTTGDLKTGQQVTIVPTPNNSTTQTTNFVIIAPA